MAHCSKEDEEEVEYRRDMDQRIKDRSSQMIREAENGKAQIYEVPGRHNFMQTMMIDDSYIAVGSHIDQTVIQKIKMGVYIDFSKLLSRDRSDLEDDIRMEQVNKNGMAYWTLVSEREKAKISNVEVWNTAFRVFMKIYTGFFPSRAVELVEYSHTINTISESYTWRNVYKYDKEFRMHMEMNPNRNWGIILHKAWSLCLRDRIAPQNSNGFQNSQGKFTQGGSNVMKKSGKLCYRYNSGKCTYGLSCKFQHKCGLCQKFGHGAHICRKAVFADRIRPEGSSNKEGEEKEHKQKWRK